MLSSLLSSVPDELLLVCLAFTVTEIDFDPSTSFSSVSPTLLAVIVIVAVPCLTAVNVILSLPVTHTDELLTFTILESDELIKNLPSQFVAVIEKVDVPPSVKLTDDFDIEKEPFAAKVCTDNISIKIINNINILTILFFFILLKIPPYMCYISIFDVPII